MKSYFLIKTTINYDTARIYLFIIGHDGNNNAARQIVIQVLLHFEFTCFRITLQYIDLQYYYYY